MNRLNGMMTTGFIVLVGMSIGIFGISSVTSAFGYGQNIWPLWFISLFTTFGVMLTIVIISIISIWNNCRNRFA